MANKKNNNTIEEHKFKVIENNQKLIEILFYIFQCQVLELDLKEFCLKHELYKTESQFNRAITNLKTAKVIRFEKLVKTKNNIIIPTPCVFRYLGYESKTIQVKVETVTRNSYTNYILLNYLNLDLQHDMQSIANNLKDRSTLLSTKRDVEACYKPFNLNLTNMGIEAKKEALYREAKRKVKLNNRKSQQVEEVEIKYNETLQTLRESDVFAMEKKDTYKIYITDNNSDYQLSNLSSKIATTIRILCEQTNAPSSININILVKDNYSKRKLDENFILTYQSFDTKSNKEVDEIAITQSINKKIDKYSSNIEAKYELLETTKEKVYKLKNTYKYGLNVINKINIKVINTDIAKLHNSDVRALALVAHQEEQKRKRIEEEIERRVKEELEKRVKKEKERKSQGQG